MYVCSCIVTYVVIHLKVKQLMVWYFWGRFKDMGVTGISPPDLPYINVSHNMLLYMYILAVLHVLDMYVQYQCPMFC